MKITLMACAYCGRSLLGQPTIGSCPGCGVRFDRRSGRGRTLRIPFADHLARTLGRLNPTRRSWSIILLSLGSLAVTGGLGFAGYWQLHKWLFP